MRVSTALRRARKIIADPRRWCRETAARDENGAPVVPQSRRARRFCAVGALARATVRAADASPGAFELLDDAACELFGTLTSAVNDGRDGRRRALRAYDRAIELALEKEAAC